MIKGIELFRSCVKDQEICIGLYGGAVANPITILCEMIAKMKDEHNHIIIPGFYDNAIELTSPERKILLELHFH